MPDRADMLRALAAGALGIADRLDRGETVAPPELLEVLLPGMDALLQLAEAGIVPAGMPPAVSLLEALARSADQQEARDEAAAVLRGERDHLAGELLAVVGADGVARHPGEVAEVWSCGECSELVTETSEGWRGVVFGSLFCASGTSAAYFGRRHDVDRSHRG